MCSIKKVVPRNFAKFTGKHLRQSLLFNKVPAFRLINSIIKQCCSCCIILIKIDTILSKNIYDNFQNLLFKKLLVWSGDQTDIFGKFYSTADTLWLPKAVGRVLGYTNDIFAFPQNFPGAQYKVSCKGFFRFKDHHLISLH